MKSRFNAVYGLMLLFAFICVVKFGSVATEAQQMERTPTPTPTPTATPTPTPINWSQDPMLKRYVWRGIGPASMGGRIDDLAVVESDPYTYYVGYATGGVWKTINNGTTWEPIFDTYSRGSIGDLALAPTDPNILWVGTGEPNNRQSSSFGDGIYKSTDAGKTFTHMGLRDSQSIARIVIDPKDPNIVYVAVVGHLFGPNKERGVYKTIDGGKTWTNIHFINEDTGATDIVMDPSDNKTLFYASYQRRRTSWGFNGGGPGSGMWKTSDSGKTWKKVEGNGLPTGLLGRIGIDISRSNPNIMYAQMEVGASIGTGGEEPTVGGQPTPSPSPAATPTPGASPGATPAPAATPNPAVSPTPKPPDPKKEGVWRSDDKGKTWRVVSNENNRPMYYSQIRVDPKNPETVYVTGLNFSISKDGGKTFKSLQPGIPHSDHHAVWINPNNGNHLIIGNDGGLNVSYDQGATWEYINTITSSQFYAIGADMRKPYYVYGGLQDNGSWGGPSQTRNPAGITNSEWFRVGGGDGFYTQVDPTDYNTVYAESQNGNMFRLDLRTGRNTNIRPRAAIRRGGGGGGQQQAGATPSPSPGAAGTATPTPTPPFGGGGFGGGFGASNIVPAPPPNTQLGFYWNTPILISPHNPRVILTGGERFFKSLDRGDTWMMSQDLTKQIDRDKLSIMGVRGSEPMASKNDGYQGFGFIVTISESPVLPGVYWAGTDDGNLQVSRDGGVSWTNVAKNIPGIGEMYHMARVEASHFDAGTCYVAVDGHRDDDLKPYIFVTRDYGATWKSVTGNLPAEGNVNVVREDLKNRDLLYAGTEFGMYISLNGGGDWKPFMSGLPAVRVDDILVHPRDNDLIIGTHGRGIYILDDITALQQLNSRVMDSDAFLFETRPATQWLTDVRYSRAATGAKIFRGANPLPGTVISYYLKSVPADDVKITISDVTGRIVRNMVGTKEVGLNRMQWNMRGNPPPRPANFPQGGGGGGGGFGGQFLGQLLEPGTYLVKLTVSGKDYTSRVIIEPDTTMNQ